MLWQGGGLPSSAGMVMVPHGQGGYPVQGGSGGYFLPQGYHMGGVQGGGMHMPFYQAVHPGMPWIPQQQYQQQQGMNAGSQPLQSASSAK